MNLGQIKQRIYSLGFETADGASELYTNIIESINEAINVVAREIRPIYGTYKITQNPFDNLLGISDTIDYDGVTPKVYSCVGAKSYYFECNGNGTVTITDDAGTNTLTLTQNSLYGQFRGFANGNVTITFSGEFSYNIRNLAVYGQKSSNNVSDIPEYRKFRRYDFLELTKESGIKKFIEFADKVIEADGNYTSITNFNVERNSTIVLDGLEECEYTIFYKKSHTEITETTPDNTELELDHDLHYLVPYYACYFVWLDDDERKATQYYNMYETRRNEILGRETKQIATIEVGGYYA